MTLDAATADAANSTMRQASNLLASRRLADASKFGLSTLVGSAGRGPETCCQALELKLVLATYYFLTRRHIETLAQADELLRVPGLPSGLRARAELARLRAQLSLGDVPGIHFTAERLLGGEESGDESALLAGALVATGMLAWDGGRAVEALLHVRAAVARSARSGAGDPCDRPDLYLAAMLTAIGEFEEARNVLSDLDDEARYRGDAVLTALTQIHAARLALATGQLELAADRARAAGAFFVKVGASYYDALISSVLVTVACAAGDTSEARRAVGMSGAHEAADISLLGWAASVWRDVDLAEAESGPTEALAVLTPALRRPLWRRRLLLERPHGAAWWVQAALSVGDIRAAAIVVMSSEELECENAGIRSVAGTSAHARGVYRADVATIDRAAELYRHPWSRAAALEDGGTLAAKAGRTDARQRLEHARQNYAECAARQAVARVSRRVRDLGSSSRLSRAASAQPAVVETLTCSERRVASAVATGMTNAEAAAELCLSRYTVDFHLRQIFRKLRISSRVELARLVAIEDCAVVKVTRPEAALRDPGGHLPSEDRRGK